MNAEKLSIFITLAIITFFSCKLHYEDNQSKLASFTETTYDELNSHQTTKKQEHQRSTKDLKTPKEQKDIVCKLFEILKREMAIIKKDKLQKEIPSQFGLKNSMFEIINVYKTNFQTGAKLREKMNSNLIDAQRMRRQFYSSLSYNTTDIFNLSEIVNKLYKNPKTHETIKKMLGGGGMQIQQRFEVALENLAINMKRLKENTFNKKTLEEIYTTIVDLLKIKKEWLNTIERLIVSSNATLELQNNIEKLNDHIQKTYKDKIASLCFKSEQALTYLDTLFKLNNN
ncbi:complement regulator-acquiring protein (plasmid) [Borreliella turdi]|uniref:complement regulator-acquiring protein n=1 Tax=Borreliella turdi TaxID=57863 RepID=UPI002649BB3B|nr:complement regulator-acquiring protein [Borreliella turdi]WKC78502.1 complement regulator-acquiring protein [Borreliella turdi]